MSFNELLLDKHQTAKGITLKEQVDKLRLSKIGNMYFLKDTSINFLQYTYKE